MRIALAQISSGTEPEANLELVEHYARQAAEAGARIVVFPEATMCSFARRSSDVAEPAGGPWESRVRRIGSDLGVTIVVGSFTTAAAGRVRNTLLVAGDAEARYDKIHLFDALGFTESRHIEPGDEPVVLDIEGVTVGLSICYDIRFPALFTSLARHGADVIVVAASWAPGPGKVAQWRTLATARAMDSTAFVIAVDQAADGPVDEESAPTGVGHSLVVDPSGTVLTELGEGPELAVIDLDLGRVAEVRERLPVLGNASPLFS